jgi:hypothetical protein
LKQTESALEKHIEESQFTKEEHMQFITQVHESHQQVLQDKQEKLDACLSQLDTVSTSLRDTQQQLTQT